MNNKLPPQEQMVKIPIGMDCSHTEWRHRPDMTKQLQALIDAGGPVTLENRFYKLTSTLIMPSNSELRGASNE